MILNNFTKYSTIGQFSITIFCVRNLLASKSRKQSQVAKSSAEAKILAVDDGLGDIILTKPLGHSTIKQAKVENDYFIFFLGKDLNFSSRFICFKRKESYFH